MFSFLFFFFVVKNYFCLFSFKYNLPKTTVCQMWILYNVLIKFMLWQGAILYVYWKHMGMIVRLLFASLKTFIAVSEIEYFDFFLLCGYSKANLDNIYVKIKLFLFHFAGENESFKRFSIISWICAVEDVLNKYAVYFRIHLFISTAIIISCFLIRLTRLIMKLKWLQKSKFNNTDIPK